MNRTVQNDAVVSLLFSIMDELGNELEATHTSEPFLYIHGRGTLLPAVESALRDQPEGQRIRVVLLPEQAFGWPDASLKRSILFENDDRLENYAVGEIMDLGDDRDWYVSGVTDTEIELDGNHPWAGKTLVFQLDILSVRPATQLERFENRVFNSSISCGPGCTC